MPTLEQHRAAPRTPVRDAHQEPHPARGGLSLPTLAAASAASVVAAVVVSHVWGPGTLYGAAASPIIVALVSEALQRPRRVIETARRARATRAFDPVAEGRRGLREGELATLEQASGSRRTDHRVPARRAPGRRSLAIALATGALAFVVGAFALTSGELVFGGSSVGGGSSRTTLFGGSSSSSSSGSSSGGAGKGSKDRGQSGRDPGSTTSTSRQAPSPATRQGTTTGTTTTPAPAAPQPGGTSAPQGDTQTSPQPAPATPSQPQSQPSPAPSPAPSP